MTYWALTALGRDRPGIVAAISGVLLDFDGNIEDSQMAILRGHFAVMLVVAVPAGTSAPELRRRLDGVRDELDLDAISISAVEDAPLDARPSHVLTVYGADHPGIVHAVSVELATRGIGITDLETRVGGAEDAPIYVMLMEIAAGETDLGELRLELDAIGAREGLDVSLRELEADAL